jgi:hypothetical protein
MTFDSFVYNVNAETPPMIGPSLTASNNGVALMTTTATYSGKTINGLLYNNALTGTGSLVAGITANNGSNFYAVVDPAYNGSTMALYLSDRSTVLFTVSALSGSTVVQTITSASTFNNRGPIERRRFAVEF